MFSFLDMINSSLSYFNLDVKLKSRIYIGIATLGDIYLVYVTFRLFINHVWMRAFLYCLAMVAITYFLYLNFVYYFLGRTSKLDYFSPRFAKITGQKFGNTEPKDNGQQQLAQVMANQSNGLFTGDNTIPAVVKIDSYEQHNLQEVVNQLVDNGIFANDFNGLDDNQVIDKYSETGKPVQALNTNAVPPYFELVHDKIRHRLEIYIGINQMERRAVGHIIRIGLTDVRDAHQKYRIYLAGLLVTDGPNKIPGRRGSTILTTADYHLQAQVAYRERDER
ncbi:hypothetical protein KZE55_08645 [Limosilactobacillus panis]|uniref:DUF6681 family protein n=1 Tax=Limosilactobacillus panis TaxID=47493 RepID=UPI001C98E095|nr:DUF6681 family protein [Limosilactobacillus panis]QZN92816.1 hypothetical protein KZE55_08645 [Limosilactobacillus panis]